MRHASHVWVVYMRESNSRALVELLINKRGFCVGNLKEEFKTEVLKGISSDSF